MVCLNILVLFSEEPPYCSLFFVIFRYFPLWFGLNLAGLTRVNPVQPGSLWGVNPPVLSATSELLSRTTFIARALSLSDSWCVHVIRDVRLDAAQPGSAFTWSFQPIRESGAGPERQLTPPSPSVWLLAAVGGASRCDSVFKGFSDCLLQLGDNMRSYPEHLDERENLLHICR